MAKTVLDQVRGILNQVVICARRLLLQTPGVRATVPMLRGVWGAALHGLDYEAYRAVFAGEGAPHERTPRFILRPAPPNVKDAPAVEWITIGRALGYDAVLLRAWDVASGMGLGPCRRRFHIRACLSLEPTGDGRPAAGRLLTWPLSMARWPLGANQQTTPCRLRFPAPLRLIRNHKLVERPSLADVVVSGVRRLQALASEPAGERLSEIQPQLLELARRQPAGEWQGQALDLVRYSGRQEAELEMRGVVGHLDQPRGAGELWPLLAALQWVHVGKGTVVGMGQVVVEALPARLK